MFTPMCLLNFDHVSLQLLAYMDFHFASAMHARQQCVNCNIDMLLRALMFIPMCVLNFEHMYLQLLASMDFQFCFGDA